MVLGLLCLPVSRENAMYYIAEILLTRNESYTHIQTHTHGADNYNQPACLSAADYNETVHQRDAIFCMLLSGLYS